MSAHAKLLGIDLKHGYYETGLCGDFDVVPDADTARLLRNHRCIMKKKANGADLYVETGGDKKPKIAFAQNTTLSFELRLKNPEFPLFTDPAPLVDGTNYQITYPGQPKNGFFAKIGVQRDFNKASGNNLEIAFSAKRALWVFYLITNQGGPGADFSIAFPDDPSIIWNQAEGTDRVSQKLADQYPGMRRLRFASGQLLPCRESGLRHIQLLFGGNPLIESLPNPSWRNYFQTETAAGGGSVDAIFQVVKYLTNTTLTKV